MDSFTASARAHRPRHGQKTSPLFSRRPIRAARSQSIPYHSPNGPTIRTTRNPRRRPRKMAIRLAPIHTRASPAATTRSAAVNLPDLSRVNPHNRVQEAQGMLARPLERVAANDRAEAAAVANGPRFIEHGLIVSLHGASRKDDDAPPVERALDYVADALGQAVEGDRRLRISLLGLALLDVGARKLQLDDVRAQLGRNVGGIGHHVNGGLAFIATLAPARI